jgi:UDP-N-acetyl-D-glucosamine dehydrogenase
VNGGSAETPERIAVIGLGYVGLPLALDLLEAGHPVHAVDASEIRLAQLAAGASYVDDVPDERLRGALASGRLRLGNVDEPWTDSDVVFICVPTPVTASGEPDLGPVLAAGGYVRDGLRRGDLVVLQSTTYPGTTLGPLRRVLEAGGLRAGEDFGLAFAPERVSPGEGRPSSAIPRLVGGIDVASTARAAAILRAVSPSVMEMTSPDAAELAKLFENVFRNVNIALVNELALICERLGLDVWEVIRGASTKPFGFMPFYPGPGVGGHCIPVDPYYLAARAREVGFHERFIETAGDINSQMPDHVVRLVGEALNDRGKAVRGSRVLVLGVAFKPGVADPRNTPAAPLVSGLLARGAEVSYHDPRLPEFNPDEREGHGGGEAPRRLLRSVPLAEALAADPDCVVLVTPLPEIDWDVVFARADLVVDTRDASRGRSVRPRQVLRLGAGWVGEGPERP